MTDFLLELRSRGNPRADAGEGARPISPRLFAAELAKAGVAAGAIVTFATPRRLALIARGLPDATAGGQRGSSRARAPARPPQALEGFLRKTGLTQDQLDERDGVLLRGDREARPRDRATCSPRRSPRSSAPSPGPSRCAGATPRLAPRACAGSARCRASSRCSARSSCQCEIGGVASGAATLGHRFHHPGAITIGGADDYAEKLRACHVIVDHAERAAIIRDRRRRWPRARPG